jgi:hypothetical protein
MSSFGDERMNVDATNELDGKRGTFFNTSLKKNASLSLFN